MNEGLKAAVIEAIRIFASVLVFFLAWQGLALRCSLGKLARTTR